RKPGADLDYRPTEMALGLAVEELFAALPKAYRDHVSELPGIVALLEAHAAAARARVDEIAALMSMGNEHGVPVPTGNLAAARDDAKRELGKSVASLEAIRLDLLRLHGGASDLRPITTVLEAAKELSEELDRLGRAQQEVSDVVRPMPFDLRAHTPA
ncbi:MAG TPA: hypothetical protein VKP00_05655, partial [Gemmatimonadaceae bacterium]|nr:hypothetical protein [Gemmatimonadaceae bacterium]